MALLNTSSRAITPYLFQLLAQEDAPGWVTAISGDFLRSTQELERMVGVGTVKPMEPWRGAREVAELIDADYVLKNIQFQSAFRVSHNERLFDNTGQVATKAQQLVRRYNQHWGRLGAKAIDVGTEATSVCYDLQPFFSVTHAEGSSGVQSNRLSVVLPGYTAGATTKDDFHAAVFKGLAQMMSLKDDNGEPGIYVEDVNSFVVMVPPHMLQAAAGALNSPLLVGGTSNDLISLGGMTFSLVVEPRLTVGSTPQDWADSFAIFANDGRSLIRIEADGPVIEAKAEGSDFAFDTGEHSYGVSATRNLGYGSWQSAIRVDLS
jgi:phage major head subunit gpT-like protein